MAKETATNRLVKVEYRSTDSLAPYSRNARTHSAEQVDQIVESVRKFGWTNPVLVDANGGIIAGHGRVMAAQKLGMQEVPCIELGHLSDAERRAYILADNKLALNAGWDEDLLALEINELAALGFDLDVIGFSAEELDALLADEATAGETDADVVPAIQESAVSQLGQVWLLGRHRIICGDSTNALTVDRVLAGVKPHLMVTDPPYGVEYDANWRNEAPRVGGFRDAKKSRAGVISERAIGKVSNDDRADWREAWALFPGDVAYVWHAGRHASTVQESLESSGFEIRSQIIWAKPRFAISRGHYHWQHEPCWYAVRKGGGGHWGGDRSQTTLWSISHNKSETGHSTQKPTECMLRPILNNSSPGQAVYEPFSGSGTTIIAAEKSGRVCFAVELNPLYVDMAIRRWQEFTGDSATLEGDGRTFEELEAV